MNSDDYSVTRDYTVSRQFLDQVRGVLPACHICNRPSGYVDLEGNPSHSLCSGESSEKSREAKRALIIARGGTIAPDAGMRDLGVILRAAERSSRGPRSELDKSPAERRANTMRHIRKNDPPPARRSPELISRMSERDVYDLARVRTDPMNPAALRGELVDRALRAVDLGYFPAAGRDQEQVQDHVDRLLRRGTDEEFDSSVLAQRMLATGSPAYKTAFTKIINWHLRGGSAPMLTPEETKAIKVVDQVRAMGVSTGAGGAFALPWSIDPTILGTSNSSINPYRQVCRTVTITGNEVRAVTTGGMTAAYQLEGAVASDQSATLAQVPLITNRATAFAPVSYELADDWESIQSELGLMIQNAKDDLEATQFTTGTGVAPFPSGVLSGATGITSAVFGRDGLFTVEQALAARFRPLATWFASKTVYNEFQKLANTGSAIWLPTNKISNTGFQLIGYAANEVSTMTTAITTTNKVAVLLDPRYYLIADRAGIDLEVTTPLFSGGTSLPAGQKGLYAMWRNHAVLLNAAAARVYQVT